MLFRSNPIISGIDERLMWAGGLATINLVENLSSDSQYFKHRYYLLNLLIVCCSSSLSKEISSPTGINEEENNLLSFIKQNQTEVAKAVGATSLYDISIDDLGDVGAIGIFDVDGDEMESGLAFRYPENVDDDFVGENGDEPEPITVAGKKLMYVGYNI